jgi:magnesium-transporting ATPase (P-type)
MTTKYYNVIFYSMQVIGIISLILAWTLGQEYLLLVVIIAILTIIILIIRYGPPKIPENLSGFLEKYMELKLFLGRHYIVTIVAITQLGLLIIWLVVIFKAKPPEPLTSTQIIISIVLSEIIINIAVVLGIVIGKRIRNRGMD